MNHPNEDFIAMVIAKDSIVNINFEPDEEGHKDLSVMIVMLKSNRELKYLVCKEWIEGILSQIKDSSQQFIELKINVKLNSK
jgi:hypothetical protein